MSTSETTSGRNDRPSRRRDRASSLPASPETRGAPDRTLSSRSRRPHDGRSSRSWHTFGAALSTTYPLRELPAIATHALPRVRRIATAVRTLSTQNRHWAPPLFLKALAISRLLSASRRYTAASSSADTLTLIRPNPRPSFGLNSQLGRCLKVLKN